MTPWTLSTPGVLMLPSGRTVRGRGRRAQLGDDEWPDVAVYLLRREPPAVPWAAVWVPWPDWGLPTDRDRARHALVDAWQRAPGERVDVVCGHGRGRTGTALACLAVLDGVDAGEAVAYVRSRYHPRAVETPWQRRYVAAFGRDGES